MCVRKIRLFVSLALLQIGYAVDLDYFYNTALRSYNLECLNQDVQLQCQEECGMKSALCIQEDCYCISITSSGLGARTEYYKPMLSQRNLSCRNSTRQFICQTKCGNNAALCIDESCYCISIQPLDDEEVIRDYTIDYEEDGTSETIRELSSELEAIYAQRPTLRHHIAHFCPNLDVARACIRKCIAVGKPAFCGKDHVCYCGHTYEHSVDTPKNSKKIYAEFKDMYDKYFGKDLTKDTYELE